VTNWNQIPNSVGLRRAYGGTEVQAGTAVTPTFRLYGNMKVDPKRALADREEFAGTYFADYSPIWGPLEITGTYEQPLSYEDLPILLRYGLVGGVVGVSDAEGTPGYLYEHKPAADSINLDTMTLEYGTPGMPWRSTCLFFEGFTISGDIDDSEAAWKWSSPVRACTHDLKADVNDTATGGSTSTVIKAAAGWVVNAYQGAYVRMLTGTAGNIGQVRRIASNDATTLTISGLFPSAVANADTFEISGTFTTGISDRTREVIDAPGTLLYLDTATLGTTVQTGRFISFSVTYEGNASLKRFMENVDSYAPRIDQGKKRVTGQVRLEFDNRDEYDAWKAQTVRKIRIKQTGSTINAHTIPTKLAQIDIFAGYWGEFSVDERNNNITATWQFRGYVDASEASPIEITVKNAIAANP
jgi:hypothetical protein